MPNFKQSTNLQNLKDMIGFEGTILEFAQWVNDNVKFVPGVEEGYKVMKGRGPREGLIEYYIYHKTVGDDAALLRVVEFGRISLWTLYNYERYHADRSEE